MSVQSDFDAMDQFTDEAKIAHLLKAALRLEGDLLEAEAEIVSRGVLLKNIKAERNKALDRNCDLEKSVASARYEADKYWDRIVEICEWNKEALGKIEFLEYELAEAKALVALMPKP